MPKTGTKLQEVFDKHLAYEIDRLAEIYALLAGPDTFGFSSLSKDIQDTMKDALIVAFCIHAKNLIEFLTRKPEQHHAASADYTNPSYNRWEIKHGSSAHALRGKLNNQLSHLTFERTDDPSEKIGIDERKELLALIHGELVRWASHLNSDYDASRLHINSLATAKRLRVNAKWLGACNHTTTAEGTLSVLHLVRATNQSKA